MYETAYRLIFNLLPSKFVTGHCHITWIKHSTKLLALISDMKVVWYPLAHAQTNERETFPVARPLDAYDIRQTVLKSSERSYNLGMKKSLPLYSHRFK